MRSDGSNYALGINIGFAVNRFPEPADWVPAVAEIGVKRVQFVADLLSPDLPGDFRARKVSEINQLCNEYDLVIESGFTGAFTRVNHFGSLEKEVRNHWQSWFRKYVQQICDMGATSIGGHPGIISLNADMKPDKRMQLVKQIAEQWAQVLDFGKTYGLQKFNWEPMSISRELGHTIEDAKSIQGVFKEYLGDSSLLCLDLDHGDLESTNPDDTNPSAWIRKFKDEIGMLHLKQTSRDRRKNMSFTKNNNELGTVKANQIVSELTASHVPGLTMFLELGFRERNPDDRLAISEHKESVSYWLDAGAVL